jgi:hypothetical protein
MEDADFWIQKVGTDETIGTPHENMDLDDIGVKVIRTDILVPKYLFYVFQYLQMQGVFKHLALSGTQRVLTVKSIENLPLQQS